MSRNKAAKQRTASPSIVYEWDVETVQAVDTARIERGEILDHDYFETLPLAIAYCMRYGASVRAERQQFVVVLVRATLDGDHSWAYLRRNGTLPAQFTQPDADGVYRPTGVDVPHAYHVQCSLVEQHEHDIAQFTRRDVDTLSSDAPVMRPTLPFDVLKGATIDDVDVVPFDQDDATPTVVLYVRLADGRVCHVSVVRDDVNLDTPQATLEVVDVTNAARASAFAALDAYPPGVGVSASDTQHAQLVRDLNALPELPPEPSYDELLPESSSSDAFAVRHDERSYGDPHVDDSEPSVFRATITHARDGVPALDVYQGPIVSMTSGVSSALVPLSERGEYLASRWQQSGDVQCGMTLVRWCAFGAQAASEWNAYSATPSISLSGVLPWHTRSSHASSSRSTRCASQRTRSSTSPDPRSRVRLGYKAKPKKRRAKPEVKA